MSLEGNTISHYQIGRKLGEGGMGEVYLAHDMSLHRKVAIKVFSTDVADNASRVERFVREAQSASALNHPHICTIHEINRDHEPPYMAMEYIEGESLAERIEKGPLDISQVVDIAVQVADALGEAHDAGIVHRDIKPANIMLNKRGAVKVLDFGLAKKVTSDLEDKTQQQLSISGVIMGTVSYMSPEQARGEAVDGRTDIFSLGITIYEMVAGETPFAGNTIPDAFAKLINKEPPPLSQFAPGIPDELRRIVSKMLCKKPDERYQTMKGVLADLREVKESIPVGTKLERASPVESERDTAVLPATTGNVHHTTVKNEGSGAKRYRWPILLAVVSILVAAIFGGVWYWRQASVASQPEIRSLAVLPLKSLDSGENYLGLGIADTVIRKISQTGQVTVRPTSAVRHYLTQDTDAVEAAKQLKTDAVLEGNVQRADDRFRVSVNLLRTIDGASIWTDSFDMRWGDIFAIQDAVAQQVASRLRLRLDADQNARLKKHATANPVAYDYYLRGVYSFDQRTWGPKAKPQAEATAGLFKNAIAADPAFALAHAQLANVYAWIAIQNEPENPTWFDSAEEEIRRTDALDPNLAETHIARMTLLTGSRSGYQWEAGIREVVTAQKIEPDLGHADLAEAYYHIGLEELAEREYNRALEIDPTSQWTQIQYVLFLNNYRRYDDLDLACKKYFPDEQPFSDYFLGKGDLDEAAKLIDEEIETNPDNPWIHAEKAILLGKKGDQNGADASVRDAIKLLRPLELTYHHMTYQIACAYAAMGKKNDAMKWLRETTATGYPVYPVFARDSFLDSVRKEPEFIQFMTEMKSLNDTYRSEFSN